MNPGNVKISFVKYCGRDLKTGPRATNDVLLKQNTFSCFKTLSEELCFKSGG